MQSGKQVFLLIPSNSRCIDKTLTLRFSGSIFAKITNISHCLPCPRSESALLGILIKAEREPTHE